MKSLLLLTLTLIILTYGQKTGGGGGGKTKFTTTTTTEEPDRQKETPEPTREPKSRDTYEPTRSKSSDTYEPTAYSKNNQPTEGKSQTYGTEPTSKPTTPSPTIPINATIEECRMRSYTTVTCSCGTMCSSYSREYFGVCPEKCGQQILSTGEFGKEPCDLNDFFAKDMSKNYSMIVLPCSVGEFAFEDKGYKMNIGLVTIAMCVYYVFVH